MFFVIRGNDGCFQMNHVSVLDTHELDQTQQWDPDHDPHENKLTRRAIQLGLRGEISRRYMKEWIVEIKDISSFVATQRQHVQRHDLASLMTPREQVYTIERDDVRYRLGIKR